MKIVILDGHAMNPGDLDYSGFSNFGECQFYPRTSSNELIDRAKDAEILISNKVPFDKATLSALPKLKYIGITATGYNIVDCEAAKARGILVTNVPAYSTASVAQMTFALLLEIVSQVGLHAETVRKGQWASSADFCYWDRPLVELSGLTMGLVGFGDIAQAVANIAKAFGMKVLVHTRTDKSNQFPDIDFVSLENLLKQSDVVSLHCPLAQETNQMIDQSRLNQMKSSAILINTSRGALIDEVALAAALEDNVIYAAGLDVLTQEPPKAENPLLKLDNCFITPHVAWASFAARKRLLEVVLENIQSFVNGHPQNVVNV